MAIIIPIKNNANHTLLVELQSKIYKIWFKFNVLGNFWTMDIYSEDDILLLAGIKIVANYPLIFSNKNSLLPTGDFVCETSDISAKIVRDSFSSDKAKLLYLTEAEVETL
jgi:hypothetical protein